MGGDVLAPVQQMMEVLGISVQIVITIVVTTLLLAAVFLTGQGVRIVVWIEDLAYRLTQPET